MQIILPWSNYLIAKNQTDENLAVDSYDAPPFNGSTTVAQLSFRIKYEAIYLKKTEVCQLGLTDTKLTAPLGECIYHMAHESH